MIDLTTNYLGLKLKNPVVVSASPLTEKLENFARLRDAGASAIVMYSLFEEQIEAESENLDAAMEYGTNSYAESTSYLPDMPKYHIGPDRYLELLHKAKKEVDVPIIASLNGNSRGGWTRYAEYMQEAGADALELNIFNVPTDPSVTSEQLEKGYCELVRAVRKAVKIPVSVKLGPYFTSMASFVKQLSEAGADGVVIFNRFYQPDFDLEELEVTPNLVLSSPHELRLRLHWAAILYHQVETYIAITGGVHDSTRRAEVDDGRRSRRHDYFRAAQVRHRAHRRGAGRHRTLDGRARVPIHQADARQHEPGEHREPHGIPARELSQDAGLV